MSIAQRRPTIALAAGLTGMRAAYNTLLVLGFALVAPSGWAGEARTLMLVSTTVVAHSSVEKVGSAAGVTVAAADLKRGYLDVIRTYRLRSNAQRGVQLQLHPRVGLTRHIDVAGPTGPLQIGDTSVEVTLPATDQLQLHFRLWLRPDVVAGSYPLPVHLMALAI